MIATFILLSCVALVRNKTLLINEYVCDDRDIHVKFQKYQNSRITRKSKGLRKSGFYALIVCLTINANNIHSISKKDYILLINTLTQICIIANRSPT